MSQLDERASDANDGGAVDAVAGAAGRVVEVAGERGKDLAGGAVEEIRKVGSEAALQAQHLLEDARNTARTRAHSEVAGAASGLRQLADQGQALVEGRAGDAGTLVQYTERGVERIRQVADSLNSRGPAGIVADVQGFARRRPGAFLAMAGVGGFVMGRMVRSGVLNNPASDPDASSEQMPDTTPPEILPSEAEGFLPFQAAGQAAPGGDLDSPWLDLNSEQPGVAR